MSKLINKVNYIVIITLDNKVLITENNISSWENEMLAKQALIKEFGEMKAKELISTNRIQFKRVN